MEKIKQSNIAGTFYPKDKKELKNLISGFQKSPYPDSFKTRAVIVPHAGLIYSGNLAYKGLSLLSSDIEKVFIFAPAHRVAFEGISVLNFDFFETPFGKIEIDKELVNELKEKFGAKENDEAFELEHSIEVQLPLIQSQFKNLKIIPVLIGQQNFELISNIIENYYDDKHIGFIISSDLSHFLKDNEAKKTDNLTAEMIESGDLSGFRFNQACGIVGIAGLVNFANKKGFSLIRVGMQNSSDTTGDKSRVVGYGAWALYKSSKNEFLKEYYSDFILNLAKTAIKTKQGAVDVPVPYIFNSYGASFVTLEKRGNLRGCIGSIIAHRPLFADLVENARNAAYFDPRFKPVSEDEIDELKIAISILSHPVQMNFKDEKDLLDKIVENKDGIIIKDKGRQAVFLPSVWEQLPNKEEFLNSLKVKAGLPYNHFSETFEAYRFYTTYIK